MISLSVSVELKVDSIIINHDTNITSTVHPFPDAFPGDPTAGWTLAIFINTGIIIPHAITSHLVKTCLAIRKVWYRSWSLTFLGTFRTRPLELDTKMSKCAS